MHIQKIAAAAGFACGAALALAPLSSADASSNWLSAVDSLWTAGPAAAGTSDFQVSFNGMDLFPTMGNDASATTVAGQFGLAIAFGEGAKATAEGGIGNYALASGTNALANAGSLTAANGYNYNIAEDIGNNTNGGPGAPDGAFAGGGSLVAGGTDSGASSNNAAYFFGNGGPNTVGDVTSNGNSGAFAGDSQLIGYMNVAGSGNTAYTAGNLSGENDGSAAVGGTGNLASSSGNETGINEGAFSAFGNNNQAIADTTYTVSGKGVDATFGNNNYAYVYGPNNSTADAGGNAAHLGNGNIAYVNDPFGATNAADSANAGSSGTTAGSSDLAEVLYTHGDASATGGSNLYDILTPFGPFHSASLPAAADPAAATGISSTVSSEISSLNSFFTSAATLYGVGSDLQAPTATQPFETILLAGAPDTGTPNAFDYFLYGVNPIANATSDPGAYDLFNGALVRFDDAYNEGLYALFNGGAAIPQADFGTDLFGISDALSTQLATETASQAISGFLTSGWNDLAGYFIAPSM